MRIFDPLNSHSYESGLENEFTATTRNRFMDWAQLVSSESHGIPLDKHMKSGAQGNRFDTRSLTRSGPELSLPLATESIDANIVYRLMKKSERSLLRDRSRSILDSVEIIGPELGYYSVSENRELATPKSSGFAAWVSGRSFCRLFDRLRPDALQQSRAQASDASTACGDVRSSGGEALREPQSLERSRAGIHSSGENRCALCEERSLGGDRTSENPPPV